MNACLVIYKSRFSILLLGIVQISSAQNFAPEIVWQHAIGGTLNDEARDVQITPQNQLVLNGYAESMDGDISGQHGKGDFCLLKTDLNGNILLQKNFGGTLEDLGRSILLTNDGGYILTGKERSSDGDVTGNHGNYDFWVVKTDADGNLLWQQSFGGSDFDNAYCVLELENGGFFVSGFTRSYDGQVTNQHGHEDYWLLKLDSNGNLLWEKTYGGSGYEQASNMIPAGNNSYLICGYSSSNDGDASGNKGSYDSWTIKIDGDGNILWQKMYGGSNEDGSRDIISTPDGGYLVTGFTYSNDQDVTGNHGIADIWVYKIDGNGNLLWQKTYGGSNYEYSYSIEKSNDGNYLIAGYTFSSNGDLSAYKGFGDAWVFKIDGNGILIWQKSLGGNKFDLARDFIQTPDGEYLLVGYTSSDDGDVNGNHGSLDCWMVKLCETSTFYADADEDGYGNLTNQIIACSMPTGYVMDNNDCNDDPTFGNTIHPSAKELCNNIDDNCNGLIDENILPSPVITPHGTIELCLGNTVSFSASGSNGILFQWMRNSIPVSGATNQTYITSQIGDYSLVETNEYDCMSESAITMILPAAMRLPALSFTGSLNICQTGSVVLQAKYNSGWSYQWLQRDYPINGATNADYTATKVSTYKVMVNAGIACSKPSESIKVVKTCKEDFSFEENLPDPLLIYPNPNSNHFALELKTGFDEKEIVTISINNLLGAFLFVKKSIITNGLLRENIELQPFLPAGIYLVSVQTSNQVYSCQLIVE